MMGGVNPSSNVNNTLSPLLGQDGQFSKQASMTKEAQNTPN